MTIAPDPARRTRTGARLLGLGAYRPRRVVTNEEVCARLDVDPEWVVARSGIGTRRWAGTDETIVAMASEAARDALRAAELPADQVDVTLVATMSQRTGMTRASPTTPLS